MDTIWLGLGIFALALMMAYGINLWLIWDKLRDEEAAVRDRCYPWSYGYSHYLAAKKRYSLWTIFPVLALCVIMFVLLYARVPIPQGQALPFLGILVCTISAGYLLITFAASVIESGLIDAYALITFQLTGLRIGTMLALTLKRLSLIYLLRLLLKNAAAVMTPGQGFIRIRTLHTGENVQLLVEDIGPTVPTELLHKLFEPTVICREGTNSLELAACRSIVRRCKGKIEAQNRPEGGLTIVVELAAAKEIAG